MVIESKIKQVFFAGAIISLSYLQFGYIMSDILNIISLKANLTGQILLVFYVITFLIYHSTFILIFQKIITHWYRFTIVLLVLFIFSQVLFFYINKYELPHVLVEYTEKGRDLTLWFNETYWKGYFLQSTHIVFIIYILWNIIKIKMTIPQMPDEE
jgi:hypothetical protein